MPRPKLRTDELRGSILEVALELLEDQGAAACTIRRIAKLAKTSPPALYELFGDKGGLLQAMYVEGFRRLGAVFAALPPSDSPRADLEASLHAFRAFALAQPALSELMFSRPFTAFDPSAHAAEDAAALAAVRRHLVRGVARCAPGASDPSDAAHALLALAMGLATQERAGWLGSTEASRTRRWTLGVRALVEGLP